MRYTLYVLYCLWLPWAHRHISIVPAMFWTGTECLPYSLNRCAYIWKHCLCFIKRWRKRKTVQRPHTRKSPLSSSFLIHKMCKKCMHCHFFIWCKPPLLLLCCRVKMKLFICCFSTVPTLLCLHLTPAFSPCSYRESAHVTAHSHIHHPQSLK